MEGDISHKTHTPWKRGETVQTVRGPAAENCPRESSMRNTGIPTNVNMMKYGMRKAPKMLLRSDYLILYGILPFF